MPTRFYLHNALNSLAGTFPSNETGAGAANWNASIGTSPRKMDTTLGASQVTATGTSAATTTLQRALFGIWVSPALAAQTIAPQNVTINTKCNDGDLAANFWVGQAHIYIWRPSTGTKVVSLYDGSPNANSFGQQTSVASDGQVCQGTVPLASGTAQAGDVIICELWANFTQSIAFGITCNMFYDGPVVNTTNGASNPSGHASFIEFANALSFTTSGITATVQKTLGGVTLSSAATNSAAPSNKVLYVAAAPAPAGANYAAQALSSQSFTSPITYKGRIRTTRQVRSGGTPAYFETAYVVWAWQSETQHYFFGMFTNGWELVRRDSVQGNLTLASGSGITFPIGTWANFEIRQTDANIVVYINGVAIVSAVDPRTPYRTGPLGMMVQDAEGELDDVAQPLIDAFDTYALQTVASGGSIGGSGGASATQPTLTTADGSIYQLTFEDTFAAASLDANKWGAHRWNEQDDFTANYDINSGNLRIWPALTSSSPPTSAPPAPAPMVWPARAVPAYTINLSSYGGVPTASAATIITAFNNAFTALRNAGGGTLVIPAGTYDLGSSSTNGFIFINASNLSNVVITSTGATLKCTTTGGATCIPVILSLQNPNNVNIENISFTDPGFQPSVNWIGACGMDFQANTAVSGIRVRNCNGNNLVYLWRAFGSHKISDVYFDYITIDQCYYTTSVQNDMDNAVFNHMNVSRTRRAFISYGARGLDLTIDFRDDSGGSVYNSNALIELATSGAGAFSDGIKVRLTCTGPGTAVHASLIMFQMQQDSGSDATGYMANCHAWVSLKNCTNNRDGIFFFGTTDGSGLDRATTLRTWKNIKVCGVLDAASATAFNNHVVNSKTTSNTAGNSILVSTELQPQQSLTGFPSYYSYFTPTMTGGVFADRYITTDPDVVGSGKGFEQKYGYFEMRAKMPIGQGVYPSFLMYNHDDATIRTGNSPYRPELDIMECWASDPTLFWSNSSKHPIRTAGTTHPAGREQSSDPGNEQRTLLIGDTMYNAFHVYGAKWDSSGVQYYVDGDPMGAKVLCTFKAPYDTLFMQLALRFDSTSPAGAPDGTTPTGNTNAYTIDYVRAWQFGTSSGVGWSFDYRTAIASGGSGGIRQATTTTTQPPATADINIVDYYGTSFIYGYDGAAGGGRVAVPQPARFASYFTGMTCNNEGVNSSDSTKMLAGTDGVHPPWETQIRNSAAGIIFICYGFFESFDLTADQFKANLRQMVGTCNAYGRRAILQTTHKNQYNMATMAQATVEVAAELGIQCIDVYSWSVGAFTGPIGDYCPDGYHPNQATYNMIGDYVASQFVWKPTSGGGTGGGGTGVAVGPVGQDPAQYHLTFEDHFDGSALDTSKWTDAIWYVDPSTRPINYRVVNSMLKVWPLLSGGTWVQREFGTQGKFSQLYGFFEFRAKLPVGRGLFPALWLFHHQTEPKTEIDVLEAYPGSDLPGWRDGNLHPIDYVFTVWNNSTQGQFAQAGTKRMSGGFASRFPAIDLSADFHTYGVRWDTNGITPYFDGQLLGVKSPSELGNIDYGDVLERSEGWDGTRYDSKPMYFLIDLWYDTSSQGGGSPNTTDTPQGEQNSFQIDYVRAWGFGGAGGGGTVPTRFGILQSTVASTGLAATGTSAAPANSAINASLTVTLGATILDAGSRIAGAARIGNADITLGATEATAQGGSGMVLAAHAFNIFA